MNHEIDNLYFILSNKGPLFVYKYFDGSFVKADTGNSVTFTDYINVYKVPPFLVNQNGGNLNASVYMNETGEYRMFNALIKQGNLSVFSSEIPPDSRFIGNFTLIID